MSFSKRHGYEPLTPVLLRERLNEALLNRIWNIILEQLENHEDHSRNNENVKNSHFGMLLRICWHDFFKLPMDTIPNDSWDAMVLLRKKFYYLEWNSFYDFVEFISAIFDDEYSGSFKNDCNSIFENENTAYRFVGSIIIEITSEIEISSIESALKLENSYYEVSEHIHNSLKQLSDKLAPDYRNSVKEAISAIEAMVRIKMGSQKELSALLKDKSLNIHPCLQAAIGKLYAYRGDASGVGHSLMPNSEPVEYEDALFMLVTSSAIINLLKLKSIKKCQKLLSEF